jgi:hypothetical protein
MRVCSLPSLCALLRSRHSGYHLRFLWRLWQLLRVPANSRISMRVFFYFKSSETHGSRQRTCWKEHITELNAQLYALWLLCKEYAIYRRYGNVGAEGMWSGR